MEVELEVIAHSRFPLEKLKLGQLLNTLYAVIGHKFVTVYNRI